MFKTDDGEQISVDDYQKLKKENNRLKLKLEILKKTTEFCEGKLGIIISFIYLLRKIVILQDMFKVLH